MNNAHRTVVAIFFAACGSSIETRIDATAKGDAKTPSTSVGTGCAAGCPSGTTCKSVVSGEFMSDICIANSDLGAENVASSADAGTTAPCDTALEQGTCDHSIATPAQCAASDLVNGGTAHILRAAGADQTFVVPAGVSSIAVKLWGGGGGSAGPDATGGAGGFAAGSLSVTPGESLVVIVGAGGAPNVGSSAEAYGGGGHGGLYGADGGGRSALRRGATELITAGGGGGAGSGSFGHSGGNGGTGGGSTAQDGADSVHEDSSYGLAGSGATYQCGGVGGATSCLCDPGFGHGGRSFEGGSTVIGSAGQGAGGGGGGWFGGGAGGGDCDYNTGGGGGGGSSYAFAGGCVLSGSGNTPPNVADPDYSGNAGRGAEAGESGAAGLVVIRY